MTVQYSTVHMHGIDITVLLHTGVTGGTRRKHELTIEFLEKLFYRFCCVNDEKNIYFTVLFSVLGLSSNNAGSSRYSAVQ